MHPGFKMGSTSMHRSCAPPPDFSYRLEADDPSCLAIKCAAHTFQLLMADVSNTPLMKGAIATMEGVLEQLGDRDVQNTLKALQKAKTGNEGALPVKPVATRCPPVLNAVCYFIFSQVVFHFVCDGVHLEIERLH